MTKDLVFGSPPDEILLWRGERVRRYEDLGLWTGTPISPEVQRWGRITPNSVCLVDGEVRMTYSEMWARVEAAALRLSDHGLYSGTTVVLQLPNCWQFVVTLLACLHAGIRPVMALPSHRESEIRSLACRADARWLLVPGDDPSFDHVAMALSLAADKELQVTEVAALRQTQSGATIDIDELCAPPDIPIEFIRSTTTGRDVALFLSSGGTTGKPKLIPRTHNDYGYMARRAAEICDLGTDTVYLGVLPLGHGYPMAGPGILGTLMSGGRVVTLPTPSPSSAFAAIERERVTMTSLVPAVVHRWLQHEHSRDLSSLNLVQSAAGRLPGHLAKDVGRRLGDATLQQVYGMSEGLLCLTRPAQPIEVLLSCQGTPISSEDELALESSTGSIVSGPGVGVLLTRGPYTPGAYFRGSSADNRAHFGGGWYRTGDVVEIRTDGAVVVLGRDKDVINRGGEKIWAEEVEAIIALMPTIAEVAVVAEPDEVLGERVCAYIVSHENQILSADEVRSHMCVQGVAAFKMPERVINVRDLPLQNVGKIDKAQLRDDLRRRLGLSAVEVDQVA